MAGISGLNNSYFNYSSTLFSSMNSSSGASNLLSEYMSIKSGSYKKLLTAYYAKQANETASDKKTSSTAKKNSLTSASAADTTELNKMKTDAAALKSASDALTTKNSKLFEMKEKTVKDSEGNDTTVMDYDREAISKAVKTFASAYNDAIGTAANQSNVFTERRATMMISATSANQKMLNRVGITVGKDNKLTVDEEKLSKADVSDLKALFEGTGSYGSTIGQRASDIAKIPEQLIKTANTANASTYTNNGNYSPLTTGSLYDSLF